MKVVINPVFMLALEMLRKTLREYVVCPEFQLNEATISVESTTSEDSRIVRIKTTVLEVAGSTEVESECRIRKNISWQPDWIRIDYGCWGHYDDKFHFRFDEDEMDYMLEKESPFESEFESEFE